MFALSLQSCTWSSHNILHLIPKLQHMALLPYRSETSHGNKKAPFIKITGERNNPSSREMLTGFQQHCQNFSGCPGEKKRKVKSQCSMVFFISLWIPQPRHSPVACNRPIINQVTVILLIPALAIKEADMQTLQRVKCPSCKWVSEVHSAAAPPLPLPPTFHQLSSRADLFVCCSYWPQKALVRFLICT